MTSLGVVFDNRVQVSVCRTQPVFLAIAWWFGDFHHTPFINNSVDYTLVPPLDTSPSYKKFPVETSYIPLLSILIRITFIDSREFPLHYASRWAPKCLPISVISPSTLALHLLLNDLSCFGPCQSPVYLCYLLTFPSQGDSNTYIRLWDFLFT